MFPAVGRAQVPTPYLDINTTNYNPVTGVLVPTAGPAGIVLQAGGGTTGIKENATANGTAAMNFSGSTYFQIYNMASGNQTLLSSTNITILAFVQSSISNNASTIVGGATWVSPNANNTVGLQFRVEGNGTTENLDALAGGRVGFGTSPAGSVPTGAFSTVGLNANLSTGSNLTYYVNGSSVGTSTSGLANQVGFDKIGARDGGEIYSGQIEEIQVYNSVLTSAQVLAATQAFQASYNTVSSTQLYYNGASSGTFDNTAADNFTLGASSTPVQFTNGTNSVVFQDIAQSTGTAITNNNVAIQPGGIQPTAVTFNNNSIAYTLTDSDGTNGISGSTGLTKNFAGTLFLSGSNSFTGPVTLNGGTTVINSTASLGATTSLTINNGASLNIAPTVTSLPSSIAITSALGGSSITFNQSGYATSFSLNSPISIVGFGGYGFSPVIPAGKVVASGPISGIGGLTLNTTGVFNLAGTASYTGVTSLNSGSLTITGQVNPTNTPAGSYISMGTTSGSSSALIVSGGTANFTGTARGGVGNTTGSYAAVIVNSGTLNVTSSLSVGPSGYGEFTINGGAANMAGVFTIGDPSGTGYVNVLGGTLTASASLAGVTIGDRTTSTGAVNLVGGTLIASTVQGVGAGVLNFNGGTLQAYGPTPSLITGLGSAMIYTGGATINDGGFNVTVPQSLSAPTGTGVISIPVTASGSGYSYIPTVVITGGTLATGGAPATAVANYNASTGQVTGVTITNPGNYSSLTGLNVAFKGGGGTVPTVGTAVTGANVGGGLSKTGSGTVLLTGTNAYSGPTNVISGTLQVSAPGQAVTVVNSSFSTPTETTYVFAPTGAGVGWNFSSGFAGITNGAGYTDDGVQPVGGQYAFLQDLGTISQSINFATPGTYLLSFYSEERNQSPANTQAFNVSIGSTNLSGGAGFTPGITWAQQTYSFTVAAAGPQVLTFQGLDPLGGDNTALLNNVLISQIGGTAGLVSSAIPSTSQVNVSPGATFDLNSSLQTVGSLAGSGNVTLGTGTLSVGGDNASTGNFSGVISGTGNLVKIGTGVQTLSGTNTFTGSTNISNGAIALGAGTIILNSPITVQNGGMLAIKPGAGGVSAIGNGSSASITVLPGGSLNLTDNAIGKLNILTSVGSTPLTFGASGSSVPANLVFEISNNAVDMIAVTGNVSELGPVYITVSPLAADTAIVPGSYTLMTAGAGLGNSNFSLGASSTIQVGSTGYALSLSGSTSTSEILTVVQTGGVLANAYWTGGINNVWSTNVSNSTNFNTDATSGIIAGVLPTSVTNVFFTTSNPTAGNLATVLTAPQAVNSLSFNGNANAPVSITGSTLSIVGAGTNSNAAGNGINISSGSSAVTINSTVNLVNSQTWTNNSTNPLTMNGSIGGLVSITQAGPGLVVLAGSNSFSGGYNLSAGTLDINSVSALGTGTFIVNTATTIDNTSAAAVALGTNNTQAWNANFTFTGSSSLNMGTGAITISGNRTITLTANTLQVGGISDGGSGYSLTTVGNGNLILSGSSGYSGATAVTGATTLSYVGSAGSSGNGTLDISPAAGQSAVVNFNTTGTALFTGSVTIADNTAATGALNLINGTLNLLTTGGYNYFTIGNNGYGSFTMAGGNLTVGSSGTPSGIRVGANSGSDVGVFTQTGGNVFDYRYFAIAHGGQGLATFTGGTTNVSSGYRTIVGDGGIATMNLGTLAGGSNVYTAGGNGGISVGSGSVLNLNAGTLIMVAGSVTGSGSAVVNLNGAVIQAGVTGLTLTDNTPASVNVYNGGANFNVPSGLSATVSSNLLPTTGNGIYAGATGGTFSVTGNSSVGYVGAPLVTVSGGSGSGATANAIVQNGVITGVTLTNPGQGYNAGDNLSFTFNDASGAGNINNTASTFNYTLTTADITANNGGLNKLGAGTLLVTGTNTYTGTTKISAGTLQLPKGNSLPDSSFETPVVGTYTYAPSGSPWTFSTGGASLGSGIIPKGNPGFIFNNAAPDGNQAAFIQNNGYINQTINLPQAATYTLSFYTEQRENGGNVGGAETLSVILNTPSSGQQNLTPGGTFTPGATWAQTTYLFNASAGSYGFEWLGTPKGTDSTAYLDNIIISGGGLAPSSYGIPSVSPVVIFDNATLDLNGDLQQIGSLTGTALSAVNLRTGVLVTGNDNTSTTFAGSITGIGSVVKVGTGTQIFSGSNNYSGGTQVSGGTLAFASPAAFTTFTPLNITTGGTAVAVAHTSITPKNNLFVSGLSIAGSTNAWTGTLDLSNNDMVVRTGSLATVSNQVAQGYAGGTWQGAGGILSSAAAANPSYLTALGAIQNSLDQNGGSALFATFDGQSVLNTDILVKYTYYGDANLDGQVDGSDYSLIDNSYAAEGFNNGVPSTLISGWYNGDFNYDGVVDGSDYTLMDNAYNAQGAQLTAQLATATAVINGSSGGSSVPEPTTLSLLAIGAAGVLGRRRRRH